MLGKYETIQDAAREVQEILKALDALQGDERIATMISFAGGLSTCSDRAYAETVRLYDQKDDKEGSDG